MAGKTNDDHARALEALSAGGPAGEADAAQNHDEDHQTERSPAPTPEVAQPAMRQRPQSPLSPGSPAPTSSQPKPPAARKGGASPGQLHTKQTIIPILLTMGTVLPLAGIASVLMGEDSLIGEGLALPATMILLGLLILGAAVATMLQVKSVLTDSGR